MPAKHRTVRVMTRRVRDTTCVTVSFHSGVWPTVREEYRAVWHFRNKLVGGLPVAYNIRGTIEAGEIGLAIRHSWSCLGRLYARRLILSSGSGHEQNCKNP